MNTHDAAVSALAPFALNGILATSAQVELRQEGRWIAEASGSSVAWLAGLADELADFGAVRIVAIPSREVLFS